MTARCLVLRLAPVGAIAGAAIWLAFNSDKLDPALVEGAIRDLGAWAPVGHVVLFALGAIVFLPGALFGLAGGLLFGPLWGTILNLAGATLGATAAFLVGRFVAADWVRGWAGPRLQRLVDGVEAEGWRFVAFVRLVPFFPFNLTNYALGLTRISLRDYVMASVICMLPGTLAYTWLGYAGREAAAGNATAIRYGLLGLAVLAAMAFLPRLVRRLRSNRSVDWVEVDELAARLKRADGIAIVDVRGPDEFRGPLGHIPAASNLPVGELPGRLNELSELGKSPLVVVCRTDKRSASAAALLRDAGFRDVQVLRGGMERWNQQGLPVDGRVGVGST
ncbi:MAG: sulfurtransferase [Rhodospirillales bacterium]|nr:sulfurtransferase [Rhodospirillales bacterium]